MKIAIFGGTGKTGIEVIKLAINRGHDVTVLVRNPQKLPKLTKDIKVITGDFNDAAAVKSTVQGQDAVICTLGSRELYKNSGFRDFATRTIINAMKEVGVKRLIVMSSMGIGESWNTIPAFTKILFKLVMPAAKEDHEAQEVAVKTSSLDWTIIRPSGLIDDTQITPYEYGIYLKPKTSRISRINVADLMLKTIETNANVHEALVITN